MPDHKGSLFQHKHSKLVQLNTYDLNFNLIPTFELSQTLTTGTVIMAKCTLHCYITPGHFKNRKVIFILLPPFQKLMTLFLQTYQLNADMIRVLANSEENISDSIPTKHDLIANSTPSTPSTSAITKAITDFPNKRIKVYK